MIRSKRLLAVGLVAALGLVAAACGGDDDDDTGGSAATEAPSEATTAATGTSHGRGHHRRDRGTTPEDTADEGTTPEGTTADGTAPEGTAAPAVENPAVGLLFDVTGRGDKSFNDSAAAGLDAAKESVGATGTESTPTSDSDRAERMENMLGQDLDLVIGVGFLWGADLQAAALANPDQLFGAIDSVAVDPMGTPDDASRRRAAAERRLDDVRRGAGLVPRRRGRRAEERVRHDRLHRRCRDHAHQEVRGRLHRRGAGRQPRHRDPDAVHHAAAGLHGLQRPGEGQGDRRRRCTATVPTSCTRRPAVPGTAWSRPPARPARPAPSGRSASTATSTTWSTPALQPYVLTSMLKKVDVAVQETIEKLANGEFRGGPQVFDLAVGGVDYSTTGGFVDDIADQLDDFKQQIIDGEIEVPTEP